MKLIYKIVTLSVILNILGRGNSENEADISIQQSHNRIKISNEQFKQNNMALGSLAEKIFPIHVKVNGMIDVPPENKGVVNSIASGYIKKIPLLVGNIVKKNQTCYYREPRICANATRIHESEGTAQLS